MTMLQVSRQQGDPASTWKSFTQHPFATPWSADAKRLCVGACAGIRKSSGAWISVPGMYTIVWRLRNDQSRKWVLSNCFSQSVCSSGLCVLSFCSMAFSNILKYSQVSCQIEVGMFPHNVVGCCWTVRFLFVKRGTSCDKRVVGAGALGRKGCWGFRFSYSQKVNHLSSAESIRIYVKSLWEKWSINCRDKLTSTPP